MPVEKYRSVADMPRPPLVPLDRRWETIQRVWERARLLAPPVDWPRSSVERFKSVEEASRSRIPRRR